MDEGPSRGEHIPWLERALLKLRLAAPGDGRKKIKTVIRTADSWLSEGRLEAARCLYARALELAKEFRSYHLAKVASKRLTDVEQSQHVQSES